MAFKARMWGTCGYCKEPINVGDQIVKLKIPVRIPSYHGNRNQYVSYSTVNYGHAECAAKLEVAK